MKLLERTVKRTHKKHSTEELAKLPVSSFMSGILFSLPTQFCCVFWLNAPSGSRGNSPEGEPSISNSTSRGLNVGLRPR